MIIRPNIKGLIFDLDNTLYQNPVNKDSVFSQAAALAALDLGLKMTFQEALKLAEQSYKQHKSESVVFCHEYGLSEKDFHYSAHKKGVDLMMQAVLPADSLKTAFNRLAQNYDVRIVTHGSQYWAEQFMSHLGYSQALQAHQIMGLDHPFINHRKKDGPEVFTAVADLMNLDTNEIAVIEDTAENLISPNTLDMQTIFVHWGRPLEQLPRYINHQVQDFTLL